MEGTRPVQHLAEHALLQHRTRRARHAAGIRGVMGHACARAQVRGHIPARAPHLLAHLHARAAFSGVPDLGRFDRHLDGGAVRRLARAPGSHGRLARHRFRQAAFVLSLRPAFLRPAAQLCADGGDLLHPAVLGGRARLAASLSPSQSARRAGTGPDLVPPGRRARVAFSARRGGGAPAGHGGAFLPGALRDGVQRTRHLPGGGGLRGPVHRPAAAVAADSGIDRRRGVHVVRPLDSGRQHGRGAGDLVRGAGSRRGAVRAAQ